MADPSVLGECFDVRQGLLCAFLVQPGCRVDVEDVVAESLAARTGLDAGEVDVAVGETLQQLQQQAGVVVARVDDDAGLAAGVAPLGL